MSGLLELLSWCVIPAGNGWYMLNAKWHHFSGNKNGPTQMCTSWAVDMINIDR